MPRFTRPALALAGLTAVAVTVTTVQAASPMSAGHHAKATETLRDALTATSAAYQPYRPLRHAEVPGDRYAMAGGCYTLRDQDGHYLTRAGSGFAATGAAAKAEPFHFQALDLGKYLLFGAKKDFFAADDRTPTPTPRLRASGPSLTPSTPTPRARATRPSSPPATPSRPRPVRQRTVSTRRPRRPVTRTA